MRVLSLTLRPSAVLNLAKKMQRASGQSPGNAVQVPFGYEAMAATADSKSATNLFGDLVQPGAPGFKWFFSVSIELAQDMDPKTSLLGGMHGMLTLLHAACSGDFTLHPISESKFLSLNGPNDPDIFNMSSRAFKYIHCRNKSAAKTRNFS